MTYKTPDDVIEQAVLAMRVSGPDPYSPPSEYEEIRAAAPVVARAALKAAREKLEAEVSAVGGDPGMSSWAEWLSGVERGIDILAEMIGDDDVHDS